MLKKINKSKIFLKTFKPKNFYISTKEDRLYFIKDKECYGRLIVVSSKDKKEFKQKKELNDELTTKDILKTTGLNDVYLTEYIKTKIDNSRRNNTLYDTIDEIIDNSDNYFRFFNDLELYKIVSNFFEEVYNILIDEKIRLDFLYLKDVEPIYNKSNRERITYVDIDNSYIDYLLKKESFINLFNELVNTIGLPYSIISYLGDTIHYKYDDIYNCYDEFISIGVLISIIKKMNYEVDNTIYLFLENYTNIVLDNRDNTYNQLKDIINRKYNFILSIIDNEYLNKTIRFDKETRDTIQTNNIIFFYYHYVLDRIDEERFLSILKEEETENMRKILLRTYNRLSTKNSSKKSYYTNLINKIKKNNNDTNSYVRKLFIKRHNISL